jgi:hypothetical protein
MKDTFTKGIEKDGTEESEPETQANPQHQK